jgi:hypothetical protein
MTISTRLRAFRARSIVEPKTFFQALGRVRRAARDEIERLIAWLDSTIDVDEDEAADDGPCDDQELEPSLGSFDRMSDQIKAWQGGNYDVDAELDKCEDEPSLGSVGEMHVDQTGWAGGGSGDRQALQLASMLPDGREDALAVLECARQLTITFLQTDASEPAKGAQIMTLVRDCQTCHLKNSKSADHKAGGLLFGRVCRRCGSYQSATVESTVTRPSRWMTAACALQFVPLTPHCGLTGVIVPLV